MVFNRLVAQQLSNPSGLLGRHITTRFLNRSNRKLIQAALEMLSLMPDDHYLDIGCGGGASLRCAADVIDSGHIYGVDRSSDALRGTSQLQEALLKRGLLSLHVGEARALPLRDRQVTKVSAIHTIYFWRNIRSGVTECFRVLRPRGKVVIGVHGRLKLGRFGLRTRHAFQDFKPEDVADELHDAGFVDINIAALKAVQTRGDYLICGSKPDVAAPLKALESAS